MIMMRQGNLRLLNLCRTATTSKGCLPNLQNRDLPFSNLEASILVNLSNAFYPGFFDINPASSNKCQVRYVKTLGGGVDSFNGTVYGTIAYLVGSPSN